MYLLELTRTYRETRELGFQPVYLCMYGSQNYQMSFNTEKYKSDFDYKAIVMPKLKDLIYRTKPVSQILETENGQVDVKDIRVFFDTLMKCNPAYVECFLTDYWAGDMVFKTARELMPHFVWEMRESFVKACYGMMLEKYAALQHPYPSVIERLEKFGYDPKQLHHMMRLYIMMRDFGNEGKVVLVPNELEELKAVKLGSYNVEDAVKFGAELKEDGELLKNKLLKEYLTQCHTYDAVGAMKEFAYHLTENNVREAVLRGE